MIRRQTKKGDKMKKLLIIALLIVGCEGILVEPEDCAGIAGGTAEFDNCNVCDTDKTNDCVQDCAGVWEGDVYDDMCGNCFNGNENYTQGDMVLSWPIDCIPGNDCDLGHADINEDNLTYNCISPGYMGHQGTDIGITWEQMDSGVDVYAAASGEVIWVFDGKYDRCPNANEPDCQNPEVCTQLGPYCGTGDCCCYWCFAGGNVVIILHNEIDNVFATRYDHLKKNSILINEGDIVIKGQKIAEVGSAGASSGPHLHFEVWGTGFYELTEPWSGSCGPNYDNYLWECNPPWSR